MLERFPGRTPLSIFLVLFAVLDLLTLEDALESSTPGTFKNLRPFIVLSLLGVLSVVGGLFLIWSWSLINEPREWIARQPRWRRWALGGLLAALVWDLQCIVLGQGFRLVTGLMQPILWGFMLLILQIPFIPILALLGALGINRERDLAGTLALVLEPLFYGLLGGSLGGFVQWIEGKMRDQ